MKKIIKLFSFLVIVIGFSFILNFNNSHNVKADSNVVTINDEVIQESSDGTYLIDTSRSGSLKINGVLYVENVQELTSSSGFNGNISLIPTSEESVYMITSVTNGWSKSTEVDDVYESLKMRENGADYSKNGVVSKVMIFTTKQYLGFYALKSAPTGSGNYGYGMLDIENASFNDSYNYNYGVSSFKSLSSALSSKDGGFNEYFFDGNSVNSVTITYTGNSYGYSYGDSNNSYTYKCYIYNLTSERRYFDVTVDYDERLGDITITQTGSSLFENGYKPKNGEIVKLATDVEYSYEVRPKTNVASTIMDNVLTDAYIASSLGTYWSNGEEKWGNIYSTSYGARPWQEGGFVTVSINKTGLSQKYEVDFQEIIPVPNEQQEVIITDDGVMTNSHYGNGDIISVDFLSSISVTLISKVINGVNCQVYVNNVLQAEELQIENGNYYCKLTDVKEDYTVEFRYYKDGYKYNSFIYVIESAPYNEFTGDDALNNYMKKYLAISGSENMMFISNCTYDKYGSPYTADNFVFNGSLMDDSSIVFASKKSADYTTAALGIKALAEGVVSFEFKVDGAPYTSSWGTSTYGYYCKNTFTYGGYASNSTYKTEDPRDINKDKIGFIGGNLVDSCHTDGWVTFNVYLAKDEIVYIAYNCGSDYSAKGTSDKLAIRNVKFSKNEQVDVSYEVQNGVVQATLDGVTFSDSVISYTGQKLSLQVTPNPGFTFYYWLYQELDNDNNIIISKVLSKETKIEVYVSSKCRFTPLIEESGKYIARIGDRYYQSLDDAVSDANANDVIIILKNLTLTKDFIIPEGITIILPYSSTDETGYRLGTSDVIRPSWGRGVEPFVTLTIFSSSKLIVNGTLIVGGVQHAPNQASQGMTSGDYSKIINNGVIEVNGLLDVRGLVDGNGYLTLNNGATLKEPFMVDNFSGGSNTSNLYNNDQFPFVQYSTSNIQCDKIINYGALVIGTTSLFFWGSIHTQDVVLIDKIDNQSTSSVGALLWLHEGSRLEISYKQMSIKEQIGNIDLSDSGLNIITVYGTITGGEFYLQGYGSKTMFLSIPYTYQFIISNDARIIINQKYKIMPGSVVHVLDDGYLDILSNGELLVYNGLMQAPKSGKQYPLASTLKKYGFDQVGMLINDGLVVIKGRFLGSIQTTSNTGIIEIDKDANLTESVIQDGSSGDYTDNRTIFVLKAIVYGLNGTFELECGKTYKAYNGDKFTIDHYIMTYYVGTTGSSTCVEDYRVEINQEVSGRFLEYINNEYYATVSFIIPNAHEGVKVNVNGSDYLTNQNGMFKAFVKVNDVKYRSELDATSNLKQVDISLDKDTTLNYVVKELKLLESNNYELVYDKDGNITKALNLKANVYFYGGLDEVVDLIVSLNNEKYVNENATLVNSDYNYSFTHNIYIQNSTISKYINNYSALSTSIDIITDVKALYELYLELNNNRSRVELDYLDSKIKVMNDYQDIIVKLVPPTITYGDTLVNVIGVTVNGREVSISSNINEYNVSGNSINATLTYDGKFHDTTYEVTSTTISVLPKEVTLTIDNQTSVYGDSFKELTGKMTLVNNDSLSDVVKLIKESGSTPGTYKITALKLHPGYLIEVDEGTYEITKRLIKVKVLNHKPIMKASSSVISDIMVEVINNVDDNYTFEYELYQDETLKATISMMGVVSSTLDIGTYIVVPIIYSDYYEIESYEEGSLEILIDNTYYDVNVIFKDGNEIVTEKVYDGNIVTPIINVKKHDTGEVITSGIVYTINGGETIKNVGNYTINVVVNEVEYVGIATFRINKLKVDLSLSAESFIYNGLSQTPIFVINNLITGDNVNVETKAITSVNVGSYQITALQLVGLDAQNYELSVDTTKFYQITPLNIEVKINEVTQIYGDASIIPSVTVLSTIPSTDVLSSIITLQKENGINVGDYDIACTVINDNYQVLITGGAKAYHIVKRQASILIDNKTSVYGDELANLTCTVSGLASIDQNLAFTNFVRLNKETGINVGNYQITGQGINDNYQFDIVNGVYTITKRQLELSLNDVSVIYGNAYTDPIIDIIDGTLAYKDSLNDTIKVTKEEGNTVGTYKLKLSVINSNYDVLINYTNNGYSTYSIIKRKLEITLDDLVINNNLTYQELISLLKYQVTKGEVVDGDNLGVTIYLVIDGNEINDENYHKHLCGGLHELKARVNNANYDVTIIESTIEVIKPQVSVINIQNSFTYTGQEISAFNYRTNIKGYLESATDASFKAWYYVKGDVTKTPTQVINVGTYIMVVEIVHTVSYEFTTDAITEYEINIVKQDISNQLDIVGIEKDNYVIINTINRPFTILLADYDVKLQDKLLKNGVEVSGIIGTGTYEYQVTIIDANYKGEKTIKFEVINNINETINNLYDERVVLERLRGEDIIKATKELKMKIMALTDVERNLIKADSEKYKIFDEIMTRLDQIISMYEKTLELEGTLMKIYDTLEDDDYNGKYTIYKRVNELDEIARSFINDPNMQKLDVVAKEVQTILERTLPVINELSEKLAERDNKKIYGKVMLEARDIALKLSNSEREIVRLDEKQGLVLKMFEELWSTFVTNSNTSLDTATNVYAHQLVLNIIMTSTLLSLMVVFMRKIFK